MFAQYLQELTENELNITYKINENNTNSVKIMTIHKSKGLEYPICYFSGLYKKFNISDLKEKILYDKEYGIMTPYFKNGIGQTIQKELLKNKYLEEEISEKIRLFYVALTRAREKIIIINPIIDNKNNIKNTSIISNNIKLSYRSLADVINSISYQLKDYNKIIDLTKIKLTHKYNEIKNTNFKEKITNTDKKINIKELKINNNIIEEKHFSKKTNKILNKNEYNNINLGIKIHEILENIDLKNPDYKIINNPFYEKIIKNLLETKEMKNIKKANIYKEYEFIYYENETKYHGIIDLILEYNNHIDVFDYKLKNTQDNAYKKQLKGYKKYITSKTKKEINLYLYSILDNKIEKIN